MPIASRMNRAAQLVAALAIFQAVAVRTLLAQNASAPASGPATSSAPASAPSTQPAPPKLDGALLSGLKFRNIGPGFTGGRISDFAVLPSDPNTFYVAVASGGVWKTTNGGTTFSPIFDSEGSYSIGCLALDPKNPSVIWIGSGENNSQRSVGFGDGVYRSRDGGKSWENLGLRDSEHIGRIAIDPRDSNVVYVAAQGPLWRSGPERGLYKTTDGGKTWMKILDISENTGVSEVHINPRDPDTLLASAYQRRRHVWTLINGGPESAIYKSTDAGRSWRKIRSGLPEVDLGRIGLGFSPADPEIAYAIIEAADGKGGVFRSTDRGETWEKRSGHMTTSPQYYNELVCHPADADRLYIPDTLTAESKDGGKSFTRFTTDGRHVDDHAFWIDPRDLDHWMIGGDGGLYDSRDAGQTWRHMANFSITQFYRVTVDNSSPFYYVYGGTQDNSTVGGPSRTFDRVGIADEHWLLTVGGDGFETQVDPLDSMIVYSQYQHGGLVRHDRRSGEIVDIKPREKPGEAGLRWNWDSPLLISPHDHKRLYFAANILYRSDDQGGSWRAVSPDLTRQIDRNQLEVMGRIQLADAVAKSNSTSFYGNIVSFSESPKVEGLLYVGTDDGLVQVSENAGKDWRRIESFPNVPDRAYVSCLRASLHDADTVYATFDNHKMGDFAAYVLKSTDRGRTWTSIAGDLPPREIAYSLQEDHVEPKLLFLGTELGVYCSVEGGGKWIKLKGGLPTIAVRDVDIQRRENDLVLATFGRGFYVLDDYSPLRKLTPEALQRDALILPIKDALHYVESARLGGNGRGWNGSTYYAAANPPFGAAFTYYLKEKPLSRREQRKEDEKKAVNEGRTPPYPTIDQLREEDQAREPQIVMTVRDKAGGVVRRLIASREKGLHRETWDLRYPSSSPPGLSKRDEGDPDDGDDRGPVGPLAPPGEYTVTLSKEVDGAGSDLTPAEPFKVVALPRATFAAKDKDADAALAFRQKVQRLQRAVEGASRAADEAQNRVSLLRKALLDTPRADAALLKRGEAIQLRLYALLIALRGDSARDRRNEPRSPSILERTELIVSDTWYATSPPTQTQRDGYDYAADAFGKLLTDLRAMIEQDLRQLETDAETAGAPWTPSRLPTWTKE
ncbi:MAG: glycosyl hydrolase [Phycisphaerae bacterium]